jgi:hypothetical protein
MSEHVRALRDAGCGGISCYMIRAAIKAGELPKPRICDCGRMVFGTADLTAGMKYFGRKPPA